MDKPVRLTPATKMQYDEAAGEVVVVNMETGSLGRGNKHAYAVLSRLDTPTTEADLIRALCAGYSAASHERIAKSVPKVIQWGIERGLIEEVEESA